MRKQTNIVLVRGNLTRDPELRQTESGVSICNFAIANNRDYSKDGQEIKKVNYFNCHAWGKLGEIINQYFSKGKEILINSGELVWRKYTDKDGIDRYSVDIHVKEFEFCSGDVNNNQVENNNSEDMELE